MSLPDAIQRELEAQFGPMAGKAAELLESSNLTLQARSGKPSRTGAAILRLANGSINSLLEAIAVGEQDERDLWVAADLHAESWHRKYSAND